MSGKFNDAHFLVGLDMLDLSKKGYSMCGGEELHIVIYIVHPESSRTQRAFAFQTLLRPNARIDGQLNIPQTHAYARMSNRKRTQTNARTHARST